jgi:hypothetical protein
MRTARSSNVLLPSLMSCFGLPKRVDAPAARMIAAIFPEVFGMA